MYMLVVLVLQAAFYPNTLAVKLLKGKVECPLDPSDPAFEAFAGDAQDSKALVDAGAVSMTLTHADSLKLIFSVAPELKRWVANAEIATICMTQEGLKNPTQKCWESGRCTERLGYMRWTGKRASAEGSAAVELHCMLASGWVEGLHVCRLCVLLLGNFGRSCVARMTPVGEPE